MKKKTNDQTKPKFNKRCCLTHKRISIKALAPGKFEWNLIHAICKQILVIDDSGISCEIALIRMSLDFTDDQSTLVQAMAWCCQATSHYLSQCWPRSLLSYGVTRPQCAKEIRWSHSWPSYNGKYNPKKDRLYTEMGTSSFAITKSLNAGIT